MQQSYEDNAKMKQELRLFAIHQTATSLQWTDNLNPRIPDIASHAVSSPKSQVLSPKYDMDVHMVTFFGGGARDLS
jgi:hypothetical protein